MRFGKSLLCILALLVFSAMGRADDYSFTGNFTSVNDVQSFTFSVGAASNVVLRTWSYAGGTNSAGIVIPSGGFDPILALFQGLGPSAELIGQNDDGGSFVPADPVTGAHWDTYLALNNLLPGDYTVTIQDYANFSNGPTLGDGFSGHGVTGGTFMDVTGHNRDSHWAFDVMGVESAQSQPGVTPEPSTYLLLGSALLGLVFIIRRQKKGGLPVSSLCN
jgi:hypothetical protein